MRGGPCWVFGDHLEDQTPVETEACPMPTDNRFGRDHDEGLFPLRPKSTSGHPEELVDQRQPRPRMPTFQGGELLPEGEILQYKFPAITEKPNEYSESEQNRLSMSQGYSRLCPEPRPYFTASLARKHFWRMTALISDSSSIVHSGFLFVQCLVCCKQKSFDRFTICRIDGNTCAHRQCGPPVVICKVVA